MGDLEQQELQFLRRDIEIDQYDDWMRYVGDELARCRWETLVSWFCYEEYCSRCGEMRSADKTDSTREWYQYECGHYGYRWDKTHDWDPEIQGWIPKGYKG